MCLSTGGVRVEWGIDDWGGKLMLDWCSDMLGLQLGSHYERSAALSLGGNHGLWKYLSLVAA